MGMVKKLQTSTLKQISGRVAKIDREEAHDMCRMFVGQDLSALDKRVLIEFIEKFTSNRNSFFMVEIYHFLLGIDDKKARKYFDAFLHRKYADAEKRSVKEKV